MTNNTRAPVDLLAIQPASNHSARAVVRIVSAGFQRGDVDDAAERINSDEVLVRAFVDAQQFSNVRTLR